MPDAVIEPKAVREALRAIRYGKDLSGSPLLALDLVTARLREEGLSEGQESRAWALARILEAVARERLGAVRGEAHAATTPERELAMLEADFRQPRLDLQAWSALHFRYFAASREPQGEVAGRLGVSAMTFQRRQSRGHELLAGALRELERRASESLRPPHNIPHALTRFIGREAEMAEVRRLLAAHRMVTLSGPGGIGKSRLAAEIGRELAPGYADGVWLVELAPLDDGELVPSAVATALGVREEPRRALVETLVAHLAAKHVLLLLDNCEHLVAECAELTDALLRGCGAVQVLATSQEVLGVEGEAAWPVPAMTLPEEGFEPQLTRLKQFDALRLFADRAGAAAPGIRLTAANVAQVGRICRLVDGLPLAIELACPRLRIMSVDQLAERLDDRLSLLRDGRRPTRPQHESLRATLDWSYDLLSHEEQAVFRRMTVFRGGGTLDAAESVCAFQGIARSNVSDLIEQLVTKSLISVSDERHGPRYKMMAVARQYATKKAVGAAELDEVKSRHLEFYRVYAEEHVPQLRGVEEKQALAKLERERDNFRAAMRWARESDLSEQGVMLGAKLGQYWTFRADWREAEATLSGIVSAEVGPQATIGLAGSRRWLGVAALHRGDYTASSMQLEESLRLLREIDAKLDTAMVLMNLASVHRQQGSFSLARERLDEALSTARETDDQLMVAVVLSNLGIVNDQQGRHAEAQEQFESLVQTARDVGERNVLASALGNLGAALHHQGEVRAAQAAHQESLTIAREIGNRLTAARALNNLGRLAEVQGDLEEARGHFERSLAIKEEIGARQGAGVSLHNLGLLAQRMGDLETARVRYEQSLAIRRDLGDRVGIATSIQGLGDVAASMRDRDAAEQHYRASLTIALELGILKTTYEILESLACAAAERGKHRRALRVAGATDAMRRATRTVLEPAGAIELQSWHDVATNAVGSHAAKALAIEGAALTLAEAVDYALGEVTWTKLAPVVAERLAAGEDEVQEPSGLASDPPDRGGAT